MGCDPEISDHGISILAPAKVNLALSVGGLRPDGYHDVDTVMVTVGLCDRLLIEPHSSILLRTDEESPVPAGPDNLCFRAAHELMAETGVRSGACITLDKRIPVGAGLGGGSADAAATLVALNRLWDLNLALADLERIGAAIGSDVPFCVRGGVARGTGTGARVAAIRSDLPLWFVVAVPSGHVDTASAYRWLDEAPPRTPASGIDDLVECLKQERWELDGLLVNDFERVTAPRFPTVRLVLDELRTTGGNVTLSGTGPAVVCATADLEIAARAHARARTITDRAWLVPTVRARQE